MKVRMAVLEAVWQYLQVFLDVLAVVGDAAGRDAWLPHQLKADLPTQVVWDLPLLQGTHEDRLNHTVNHIANQSTSHPRSKPHNQPVTHS